MATPVWDKLHIRFSSSTRDIVSVATAAGKEMSVADRDTYLNNAFSKYVLLLYKFYRNNPEALRSPLQSMIKHIQVTAVAGAVSNIASLATDYGIFLSCASSSGSPVQRKSHEDFYRIRNNVSGEIQASSDSLFVLPADTRLDFLPSTTAGNFNVSYIAKPITITENGSVDFPLGEEHFVPILSFAMYQYSIDKQEFDVAGKHLTDAYNASPIPIGKFE